MLIKTIWWKNMTAEPEPKLRVLFDLNVVLDVLARRQPHYADAARLWAYVESGQMEGLLAAHSVTTLFYLLRRHMGLPQAKAALHDVLRVFRVAAVDQATIQAALILDWNDFEDAVQATAAAASEAAYLITRNEADFAGSPIPAIHPANFPNL
jgi:predicted nucleic acid-binding protein